MPTIGFQKDKQSKPDAEYSDLEGARRVAEKGSDKLQLAILQLNTALTAGTVTAPTFEKPLAGKIVGSRPYADSLFEDYIGEGEKSIKINLGDAAKTELLVPVTPQNVDTVVNTLVAARDAVERVKRDISPSYPATLDSVAGAANNAIISGLKSFVVQKSTAKSK